MRVKAISKGFDGMCLREPGAIFDMDEAIVFAKKDKDGNPVLPKWIVLVENKVAAFSPKGPVSKVKKPMKAPVEPPPLKSPADDDVI